MNSKTEEVRKRRGKSRSHPLNIYQKMLFVMGAFTLLLAVGTNLRIPLFVSIGVMAVTLVMLFLFKYHKLKGEKKPKEDLNGLLPESSENASGSQETPPPGAKEITVADLKKIFPEGANVLPSQEKLPLKQIVDIQEIFLEEEEKMIGLQKFDGKVVDTEEIPLKPEKEVDLQRILSQLENGPEKVVQL